MPQHCHRFMNCGEFAQRGFDFAEFDAVTAQFYLAVFAPEKCQFAIAKQDGLITGSVDASMTGQFDKGCSCEFRLIDIAAGNARSADTQFASLTSR